MKNILALICGFMMFSVLSAVHAQETCAPSQLVVGQAGRVTPGLPNRMRTEPSPSADLVDQIPVGEVFRIFQTGTCAEGYLWVRVLYNDRIGWTPEAQGSEYFVEPIPPLEGAIILPAYLQQVSWSADGHTLALATSDGIYLLDRESPDASPLLFDSDPVSEVMFSPVDPELLATSAGYGMLRIWNIATHEVLHEEISGDPNGVALEGNATGSLSFVAGGDLLFVVMPQDLIAYDTQTWEPTRILSDYLVFDATISPDGDQMVTATFKSLSEIDFTDWSGNLTPLDRGDVSGTVFSLAYSPDQTMFALSDNKGHLQRWMLSTGERFTYSVPFEGDYYFMETLAFSPDSTLLAVGEGREQGIVRLFNTATMQQVGLLRPTDIADTQSIAFSPDGTQIAIIFDNQLLIVNTADMVG